MAIGREREIRKGVKEMRAGLFKYEWRQIRYRVNRLLDLGVSAEMIVELLNWWIMELKERG